MKNFENYIQLHGGRVLILDQDETGYRFMVGAIGDHIWIGIEDPLLYSVETLTTAIRKITDTIDNLYPTLSRKSHLAGVNVIYDGSPSTTYSLKVKDAFEKALNALRRYGYFTTVAPQKKK